MHDTGSHMSGGDTSYTSHTSHTSHSPADGQPGWQYLTQEPASCNFGGARLRRRWGLAALVVIAVLGAIWPVALLLISLSSH